MAREITAAVGTEFPPELFNRQQDTSSGEAWGITLVKVDANTVAVNPAADGGSNSAGVRIDGRARYVTSQVTVDISGGAGTKSVYAIAGSGPGFTLAMSPSGPSRKIAEVDWDGSAITAIRNMVDAVSGHGHLHRPGGPDALPQYACHVNRVEPVFTVGTSGWTQLTFDDVDYEVGGAWFVPGTPDRVFAPVSGVYTAVAAIFQGSNHASGLIAQFIGSAASGSRVIGAGLLPAGQATYGAYAEMLTVSTVWNADEGDWLGVQARGITGTEDIGVRMAVARVG